MGTKKATNGTGTYCFICATHGHQRLGHVVHGVDPETGERRVICGYHLEALESGDEESWPIISNWANCKWVKKFEQLLRQLERDEPDENKVCSEITETINLGVRMKLDPKVLKRRDSYVVAGYTINRPEPAARYAHRVNTYLERFIADEAVKIARKRREAGNAK